MADQQTWLRTDAPAHPDILARGGFKVAAVALGSAVGLFLAWQAAGGLFLIFAGLLFAVFLEACARGLGRLWQAPRTWRLAAVSATLALLVIAGLGVGGYKIVQQADELVATVQGQLRALRGGLADLGLGSGGAHPVLQGSQQVQAGAPQGSSAGPQASFAGRPGTQGGQSIGGQSGTTGVMGTLLPDPEVLLRSAATAASAVLGSLGNAVVIIFLGLYVAIDPDLYRRGTLLLFPRNKRARLGAVLGEAAETLRWWILGQLVSMSVVAASTLVGLLLIGMPGALLLALQAGLLAFIPYVGTLVGGAVILLAATAQSGTMALWALGVYAAVQMTESYVITPLVQRRTVNLPPALTIAALVILGALFGIWGLALGAPLLAALRILVIQLWVGDALGDPQDA